MAENACVGPRVLRAGATALLAMSSVSVNRQCVPIPNRHPQTETRLHQGHMLPGPTKESRPGAHGNLTLSFSLHRL